MGSLARFLLIAIFGVSSAVQANNLFCPEALETPISPPGFSKTSWVRLHPDGTLQSYGFHRSITGKKEEVRSEVTTFPNSQILAIQTMGRLTSKKTFIFVQTPINLEIYWMGRDHQLRLADTLNIHKLTSIPAKRATKSSPFFDWVPLTTKRGKSEIALFTSNGEELLVQKIPLNNRLKRVGRRTGLQGRIMQGMFLHRPPTWNDSPSSVDVYWIENQPGFSVAYRSTVTLDGVGRREEIAEYPKAAERIQVLKDPFRVEFFFEDGTSAMVYVDEEKKDQ